MYPLLFLVLFIILIIIILRMNRISNINVENFYTLFLPYYHPHTIKKYNNYKNRLQHPPIPKRKITVLISSQQLKYLHMKLFLKALLAYTKTIFFVNLLTTKTDKEIMFKLNDNKTNFGVVPAPVTVETYLNNDMKNVNFVTTLSEQYIFIIVTMESGIHNLHQLKNKRIGVGRKGGLWDICIKDIMTALDYQNNYQPVYSSLTTALFQLVNHEIDALIVTDTFYPSNIMNDLTYNYGNLLILSMDGIKHLNFYYRPDKIDLTRLPANYIPKIFNNVRYVYYNSYLFTYKFSNFLLTNKYQYFDVVYDMIEYVFNFKNLLEKSLVTFTQLPMPLHPAAKEYYFKNGYLSYTGHSNCIYLYGKGKCTPQTLEKNKLNRDMYYVFA